MPKFLFWNVGGRKIISLVRLIARAHDVDLIVLAESPSPPVAVQAELNIDTGDFRHSPGECARVQFFTRFDDGYLIKISETDKYSIRRLRLPLYEEILVVGVHLPSQLRFSQEDIAQECRFLSEDIRRVEEAEGHSRTVILGDFNLNPFDTGLVQTTGLHAVSSRETAMRGSRVVQDRQYSFFYNPMWSHLGDRNGNSAGTYFYRDSGHTTYFWNVFDQVLLRPDLAKTFSHAHLQILSEAGPYSLVQPNGRPDARAGSDHLPVLLELNLGAIS